MNPTPAKRRWTATLLLALVPLLWQAGTARAQAAPASPAATDCPPVAQAPTPQQIQEGLQKHSKDRGFLWRISRDGRSSYLYGTIHIGRFEWIFPGPRVVGALREAEVLALELDPTDPATMQRVVTIMTRPGAGVLDDALKARLARQMDAACIPGAALATMHPVMQVMTLTVLAGRRDGLDPAYGQEGMLAGAAKAMQRRVVSLETPEQQLSVLISDDVAHARHTVDQGLAQLEDGRTLRVYGHMDRAWVNGDLAAMEGYERWCECAVTETDRAFLRELNDNRNPHLAERIDALHREGAKVFAAVGALHMTGPKALPRLLAERGYQVERIIFTP